MYQPNKMIQTEEVLTKHPQQNANYVRRIRFSDEGTFA